MPDHRKWADAQIAEMQEMGIDLPEAQRSVKWVLDNMPEGEDPAVWVPNWWDLDEELEAAAVQDMRVEWYAKDSTPSKYMRIIDAVEEVAE